MNICIWFKTTDGPWGGGNQFLRALSEQLTRLGHRVTSHPGGADDLVLLNAHNCGAGGRLSPRRVACLKHLNESGRLSHYLPIGVSRLFPRRGPVLVHRLDGVASVVRGHRTAADRIQPAVNRLADYTVFQSDYARQICDRFDIRPARYSIVHNGVASELFYPDAAGPREAKALRLAAVSWSDNPRKGFATIAGLSRLPEVEVYFAGNWCKLVDPANVKLVGPKTTSELAQLLRSMDGMLHAGEDECCSNAILEALASGLPLLYLDSGGNRELAGDYGVALGDELAATVEEFRDRYAQLRERVIGDRRLFLIPHAAEQYVDAFERALDDGGRTRRDGQEDTMGACGTCRETR